MKTQLENIYENTHILVVAQRYCFSFSMDGVNVQIVFIRAFSTILFLVLTDRFHFYMALNRNQHITFWSFVWV